MNKDAESDKIKSFTDLKAWREAHKLVLMIYTMTKTFPKEEIFGLTSQMRRAAVSITSNIAEGFGRHSYKEKAQFYSIALGSITELQNQLLISNDVGYIARRDYDEADARASETQRIVRGLIKGSKKFYE